mmetsp:Transcript_22306/g.50792  ORF Transcript_22306/g.50792 Transcript_22306/m.50792 type:complete len:246 (-) Transcript_22306:821-1558(-)
MSGGLVDVDLELDQIARTLVEEPIIHGRVTFRASLQLGEEVANHFCHGHLILQQDTPLREEVCCLVHSTSFGGQLHTGTDVLFRHDHLQEDVRLPDLLDPGRLWQLVCKLNVHERSILAFDLVSHGWRGHGEVYTVFTFQPLLDDLHVQNSEEAAAEAEAQGRRLLWLKLNGSIIQRQALEGQLEGVKTPGVCGKEATENHRHHGSVAGQRLDLVLHACLDDRVANARVCHLLDGSTQVADLASG